MKERKELNTCLSVAIVILIYTWRQACHIVGCTHCCILTVIAVTVLSVVAAAVL